MNTTKSSIIHWLVKSEESCYSIDDFKKDTRTAWTGIRNYQARNFMRDMMKVGHYVLFYHSSSNPTGVYGVAKVVSAPHPDETALDPRDDHFDPKATKENPIWYCVDLEFVLKLDEPISLEQIKRDPQLSGMMLTQKGNRLSVQPVLEKHFQRIVGEKV